MNIGGASGGGSPGGMDIGQLLGKMLGGEQQCDKAKGEEGNQPVGKKGEKSMDGEDDANAQNDMVSQRIGADQMQANSSQITF